MKKNRTFVYLTPEQHVAKLLKRKTVSKKFMKWMLGFEENEVFITYLTDVEISIKAVTENTIEAWLKFSSHPGADQMMYGVCVKQGLLAVKGASLVVTKKAVELLQNKEYVKTLYGYRD